MKQWYHKIHRSPCKKRNHQHQIKNLKPSHPSPGRGSSHDTGHPASYSHCCHPDPSLEKLLVGSSFHPHSRKVKSSSFTPSNSLDSQHLHPSLIKPHHVRNRISPYHTTQLLLCASNGNDTFLETIRDSTEVFRRAAAAAAFGTATAALLVRGRCALAGGESGLER